MSQSSAYSYKIKIFTPKLFYFGLEHHETDNEKIKRLLEETLEKFIRENFDYSMGLGGISRGCAYYVEEIEDTMEDSDFSKYKTDDPIGKIKVTEDNEILVSTPTEIPNTILPFKTMSEKMKLIKIMREFKEVEKEFKDLENNKKTNIKIPVGGKYYNLKRLFKKIFKK